MDDPFTPQELDALFARIDEQLRSLGAPGTGLARGRKPAQALGETQRLAIEQATGEEAMSFLARCPAPPRPPRPLQRATCGAI